MPRNMTLLSQLLKQARYYSVFAGKCGAGRTHASQHEVLRRLHVDTHGPVVHLFLCHSTGIACYQGGMLASLRGVRQTSSHATCKNKRVGRIMQFLTSKLKILVVGGKYRRNSVAPAHSMAFLSQISSTTRTKNRTIRPNVMLAWLARAAAEHMVPGRFTVGLHINAYNTSIYRGL